MLLDIGLIFSPFLVAWWLTGWPRKHECIGVKYAGLTFVLLGVSTLLRTVLFGRHMPAGKYSMRLLTTGQDLRLSLFFVTVGFIVMLAYHRFLREKRC